LCSFYFQRADVTQMTKCGGTCVVHNAGYDFNDDAIETGVACWSPLAMSPL
jgi:hypothetical protein